jgi:HAD superfamily hydrolase (TIGR01549 family)
MTKTTGIRLVLFDLDGVLLDSEENMRKAWQVLQEKTGVPIPFESYFEKIGRPFGDIMGLLGLQDRAGELEKIYMTASFDFLRAASFYPGTSEMLKELRERKVTTGIVTSKDHSRTTAVLEQLPVQFRTIQCPRKGYRGKPAPDYLLLAMAESNCDPAETIFVGDMETDYQSASRAGIAYAHAAWGYGAPLQSVPTLHAWSDLLTLIQ